MAAARQIMAMPSSAAAKPPQTKPPAPFRAEIQPRQTDRRPASEKADLRKMKGARVP